MPVAAIDDIRARVGSSVGTSGWLTLDQDRITAFADATEDRQFIHVDPAAAAATPFGGTVAHGFLTLSMLSRMAADVMAVPDTTKMVVNYGLEKVRFIAPVPAGSRVRGHFDLLAFDQRAPGQWLATHAVTVEIEGSDRPALTAQWLGLIFV